MRPPQSRPPSGGGKPHPRQLTGHQGTVRHPAAAQRRTWPSTFPGHVPLRPLRSPRGPDHQRHGGLPTREAASWCARWSFRRQARQPASLTASVNARPGPRGSPAKSSHRPHKSSHPRQRPCARAAAGRSRGPCPGLHRIRHRAVGDLNLSCEAIAAAPRSTLRCRQQEQEGQVAPTVAGASWPGSGWWNQRKRNAATDVRGKSRVLPETLEAGMLDVDAAR